MTDRELLELAAKAAGIGGAWREYGYSQEGWLDADGNFWNPLTDDGAALRLAVKLQLDLSLGLGGAGVDYVTGTLNELNNDDPYAATRRAVVRAAAAMALEKPSPRILG